MKNIYEAPRAEVKEIEVESVFLDDSTPTPVSRSYDVEAGSIEDLSW